MTNYLLEASKGFLLIDEVVVKVEYGSELKEIIADGKYGFVHQDIFSMKTRNEIKAEDQELITVCFNRSMTSKGVLEEFREMKLCPVDLIELISYTTLYPGAQINHPIIALGRGFNCGNNEFVAHAGFDKSCGRFLSVTWSGHKWSKEKRFLATKH